MPLSYSATSKMAVMLTWQLLFTAVGLCFVLTGLAAEQVCCRRSVLGVGGRVLCATSLAAKRQSAGSLTGEAAEQQANQIKPNHLMSLSRVRNTEHYRHEHEQSTWLLALSAVQLLS